MTEPMDRDLNEDIVAAAFDSRVAASDDARVEEVRRFAATCREAFDPSGASESGSEALQAARVAQRVLEGTTSIGRSPIGAADLRAESRHVIDALADRLQTSTLLRFAAALLVVQLTLVPLVAYHLIREQRARTLNVDFESPADALRRELAEDLPEPPVEVETGDALDPIERFRLEEELRFSRTALDDVRRELARVGAAAPTSELGRALAALTANRGAVEVPRGGGSPDDGFLLATMRAEAALFALEGGADWTGLADDLELVAGGIQAGAHAAPSREVALASRALAHARVRGIALPAEVETGREDGPGVAWIDQLESALRRRASGDPYLADWLEAIVQVR